VAKGVFGAIEVIIELAQISESFDRLNRFLTIGEKPERPPLNQKCEAVALIEFAGEIGFNFLELFGRRALVNGDFGMVAEITDSITLCGLRAECARLRDAARPMTRTGRICLV
jgi:hypothetical protein